MKQLDLVEMIQYLEKSVMLLFQVSNLITYNGRLNFPFCCKEEAKRKKHKRSGGTTGKAKCCFI